MCRGLFLGILLWIGWGSPAKALTYEVGPGQPLASPNQVPWESLNAGDLVKIHWQSNPYLSKWVLCRSGTANAPIRIQGVPGPHGQLPVIDGNGATTRLALDYTGETRGIIKIGSANIPADTMPRFIVIEGLEVRSGRPPYGFTDDNGVAQNYVNNAASIYVEKGQNLTIRNCILHDSGNGLFIGLWTNPWTTNVLVEANSIYDNGNAGSIYEHNSYTAALGITFQFNHYGPLRAGCPGNNLKDRSVGQVVRYNWIEAGNRQLDLVDAEDDPSVISDPRYRQTLVYGNILVEPEGAGNSQIVHYGGDSGNEAIYRKGTLYFHHNTVISTRSGNTTLFRLSTNAERCDARNNLFFVTATGNRLALVDGAGVLDLRRNWFKTGYVNSHSALTGSINNDGSNLAGSDPKFLDFNSQNFFPGTNSPLIDAAIPLAPEVTNHAPVQIYVRHQSAAPRRVFDRADLGAYEFSPWEQWRFTQFGQSITNSFLSSEWADPDSDGVPNLAEYAFLMDPKIASLSGLPLFEVIPLNGTNYLGIRFTRRLPPSELAYVVQTSQNLANWQDGTAFTDQALTPTTPQTTLVTTTNGLTRVRLNTPIGSGTNQFLRLRISH